MRMLLTRSSTLLATFQSEPVRTRFPSVAVSLLS
jgi:hypothetical protein